MANDNPYEGYLCPICQERSVETVVKIPSVRGYVLAYQMHSKRLPACASCARKAMLKEAGRSLLLGWFSPTALIVNPFLILWNLGRAPFVSRDLQAVKTLFKEAGIPDPGEQPDLQRVLYGLAAAMITADGKIEPTEIDVALAVGGRISADFDPRAFHDTVERHASLPPAEEYAGLLAPVLSEEQKRLCLSYLSAIALADGEFASSEEALLRRVAKEMAADQAWLEQTIAETAAQAKQADAQTQAGSGAAAPPAEGASGAAA